MSDAFVMVIWAPAGHVEVSIYWSGRSPGNKLITS